MILSKELLNHNKNFSMCIFALTFMFGILMFFNAHEIIFSLIFTILMLLLLVCNIFSYKKIICLVFVFYFGFFLSGLKVKNSDDLLPLAPDTTKITGRIVSIPVNNYHGNVKFYFQTETLGNEAVKGKTLVSVTPDNNNFPALNIGDKISLSGNLRIPFHSTNPSQFDYSLYLKNFNVFTVFYSNGTDIEVLQEKLSFKWQFLQKLNNTRNKIIQTHAKYLKSPNLEILGGIVFGDDAIATPEYIKNSFINSGLLHILAASGMNVAFIYSFWFFILRVFAIPYKLRVSSGIAVILLYTLMTGLGASVIRAALMLIFVLIGKMIDRDAHSVSLLSLVATLMLIYNPAYINDVSFQLSFFVTFGLLTMANTLVTKFAKVPIWLKMPVVISLVAQIWAIPIQMFYFNTISLYSVFANICASTFLSILSFSGFLSSIISLIPTVGSTICKAFDFINNYLLDIIVMISNYFGSLPYCILQTTHPEIYQLLIYYVMLIICTYLLRNNCLKQFCVVLSSFILILGLTTIRPVSDNLEITAFDVQNADCFLIKTPRNKYFMIDTGKSSYKSGNSQAKIIPLKYMKDNGIKNLEGLIVTHFDNDHAGGTVDVIKNAKVKTLYLNTAETNTKTGKDIFNVVSEINQHTEIVNKNSVIYEEPDLKISNLKFSTNKRDNDNISSIVTVLSYKDFDMLFMGDAGVETFRNLRKYIPHNVEVLKVGHHGGAGVVDNDMLTHLDNQVSLISTGINYYGHPNKGTLDLLRKTVILRTDLLNAIKISTDGYWYKIFSYNSHEHNYKLKEKYQAK